MVFDCLTLIPNVWGQLVGKFTINSRIVRPLPDEVIIQILSRLPVDCVLKCRRVCKRWEELTSTSQFADLHLKSVNPVVFLQPVSYRGIDEDELNFFVFYPRSGKDKMVTKVRVHPELSLNKYRPQLVDSCNGLLLFLSKEYASKLFVYNPVMQEQITLRNPCQTGSSICGIFFQPLTSQYKLLYAQNQGNGFLYYIYALGDTKWRRLSYFSYRPAKSTTATTVNGALHWITRKECEMPTCKHAIMVFNINREEFDVMRHPGKECRSRRSHERMQLLEMKQHLSLCQVDRYNKCLDIWMLEDYATCAWVRRYKINLDWSVKRYPFLFTFCDYNYDIKPLMIRNNELLLAWSLRGIFWYHLEFNTIRKMQSKWMEKNGINAIEYNTSDFHVSAYTKTLVTLKNRPTSV